VGSKETVKTASGGFVILAHAAGQQVLLHTEKKGYTFNDQYHEAGDGNAVSSIKCRNVSGALRLPLHPKDSNSTKIAVIM
jgi:hypothetical protein